MEMLSKLANKPKESSEMTSDKIVADAPMHTSDKLYKTAEQITTFLLPAFSISHPEKGRARKNPAGSANRMAPNAELLNSSLACMLGMREAQLAKQSPCIKKKALTAIRLIRIVPRTGGRIAGTSTEIICYILQ